eukprot:2777837-Alexandrium_andersonii.AAC.1
MLHLCNARRKHNARPTERSAPATAWSGPIAGKRRLVARYWGLGAALLAQRATESAPSRR